MRLLGGMYGLGRRLAKRAARAILGAAFVMVLLAPTALAGNIGAAVTSPTGPAATATISPPPTCWAPTPSAWC